MQRKVSSSTGFLFLNLVTLAAPAWVGCSGDGGKTPGKPVPMDMDAGMGGQGEPGGGSGGSVTPPKPNLKSTGDRCTTADECGTGLCVDEVCCETACDGQCSACNEPTLEGQCVTVEGEPRGERNACDPGAVCFEGSCQGDDASLASLDIVGGEVDQAFDPKASAYVVTYSPLAVNATITATPTLPDSTLKIDGQAANAGDVVTFPLLAQSLQVPIEVTSATGKTQSYTVVFTAAKDADYTYVKASNTRETAFFGDSVVLHEGQLLVGSPGESSGDPMDPADATQAEAGAVYVYKRMGGSWLQSQYVKAKRPVGGTQFGSSIAASGDLLAVGTPSGCGCETDQAPPGTPCDIQVGEVAIFKRNADGQWNPLTCVRAPGSLNENEAFGTAVAIDGDTLVVGSENASGGVNVSTTVTTVAGENPGAAYVFRSLDGGTNWGFEAFVKAPIANKDRAFAQTLALAGDRLVVGDPNDASASTTIDTGEADSSAPNRGAAFVYERAGGVWTRAAFLKPSNQRAVSFGGSLALQGNRLAVGSPNEGNAGAGIDPDGDVGPLPFSGAVYLFTMDGAKWKQESYIKAKSPANGAEFGVSVALLPDQLLVGALGDPGTSAGVNPVDSGNASRAGAAYLFNFNGTSWRQHAYIKASNPEEYDEFGATVATDGKLYVVGAPAEDGSSAGIDGPLNDNTFLSAGAVYLIE